MFATLRAFGRDESGATAIEYGLIAALVSVGSISALQGMGEGLSEMFTAVAASVDAANASAGGGGS